MKFYLVMALGVVFVMPPAYALDAERSGKQVVTTICAACHAQGIGGSPKIGDLEAWVQRLKNGVNSAVHAAIRGHGGMPARGGQINLTDTEIRSAILYMFYPAATIAKPSPRKVQKASTNPNYKVVDGIGIYLGLMSVQKLYELPKGSPERNMHGGLPKGSDYYHVNVTLFDARSGAPIKDAQVRIQLEQPGLSSEESELESMNIGVGSYGNYVKSQPGIPYRITLHIIRPKALRTVSAKFEVEFIE